MKKHMLIIIAAVLAVVLLGLTVLLVVPMLGNRTPSEGNDDYTTEFEETTTEYYTTVEEETTTEAATTVQLPPPVTIDGVVWRIAPALEFENVHQCCGMFMDGHWRVICPITGQLTGERYISGHGLGGGWLVYDPQLSLIGNSHLGDGYDFGIGLHPVDDFEQSVFAVLLDWRGESQTRDEIADSAHRWFESISNRTIMQQVDSTLRSPWDERSWGLLPEAFSGRYAIFENRQPISPWFDSLTRGTGNEIFAARQGNTWQFINQYGQAIIPTRFEHIRFIDQHTAFARHNGRYGILDITATAANF